MHVSTSYVERQNLTMRMHMRRDCVALHVLQFLQSSSNAACYPAMEAGLTDHVWSLVKLIGLLSLRAAIGEQERAG